ncbi:MAG TPA: hypothetical protein DD429_11010 [Clostridiaceae bacterium]|nr:hypothetical protein [Clostridiaceae bacterium]
MLKSIDTFSGIIEMRKKLTKETSDVLKQWKDYISAYPEIERQCLEDASKYDFDKEIKAVILSSLTSDFNKVETAHDNFIKLVNDLNDNFQHTFSIYDDIYLYFYIGLCNGAGWATDIDSHQAVLIGAEKLAELNWYDERPMTFLIYHELSHVAHSILRNETLDKNFKSKREKSIWQLYTEGFAQRYEQILCKDDSYRQDKDGWLKWCKDNHSEICREYLYRIKNNISTQFFFAPK